jgi:2-polyprenyl-3-methyl-5-hydroxy-6-metoxy-1,4-benzoquinol methylase
MKAREIKIGFILLTGLLVWALISTAKYQVEVIKRTELEKAINKSRIEVDSLKGVNAERANEIARLNKQLELNYNDYITNIRAIDSLNNAGLRKAMRQLLADITGQDNE